MNICSVKRAMCLLYQGRAQVVSEDEGDFNTFNFSGWRDFSAVGSNGGNYIFTPCYRIVAPRIILLIIYDKTPYKEVKLTRHNVFERDKNTCQYCGRKFERNGLNIDHVVPRDQGEKQPGPILFAVV